MGDFLTAARRILLDEGRPLSAREITDIALARGVLDSKGRTPWQTMKSKLATDILQRKQQSLFMRSEAGKFALRAWKTRLPEHIADRFQKALFDEDIIVVPEDLVRERVPSGGLYPGRIDSRSLLRAAFTMRRRDAEERYDVVQLVSAFLLSEGARYLTYKRARRLPESRLHGYYSITFGGHLTPRDVQLPPLFDIFEPAHGRALLTRELTEEVRLAAGTIAGMQYLGLLYDRSVDVSRQHIGIVYHVELARPEYEIGERGFLIDAKFETREEIGARAHEFENWSQTLIRDELKCGADG